MTILVVVASKHGGTLGIAEAIADELHAMGSAVDLREAGDAPGVTGYGAVVLGSAIYMGNWLPDARRFIERNQAALPGQPVWLFSSGPLGSEDPQPKGDPSHLAELMAATGAREHRIFVGRLDRGGLGLGERLMVRAVHAPDGDFRDWEAIRSWAREIGNALAAAANTST